MPTTDLARTVDHYERLGFRASVFDDAGYAICIRDGAELHFSVMPEHDPARTAAAVWMLTDDADDLYREWLATGVGRTTEPIDTDYLVREGAHIDPDNNLVRFASPIPGFRGGAYST
jgi:hypothetical protein